MFKADEIIDIAVRLEENAAEVYRQAIAQVDHPRLKSLLEWMMDEEKQHAEWFNNLRQRLAAPASDPILRAFNREMLDQMIGGQSFSLKQVAFESMHDLDAMIDILVEFEKDTILFYEMLSTFIQEPQTLGQLQTIISEEKRHITHLEAQRPAP